MISVIGFSDLLLLRDLPDDIKADVKIINDEANRAALIFQNLLTFARKQPEGKIELKLNDEVQRVLNLRNHEQLVNNILADTHFAPDLPKIIGNSSQLQQVFFDIIINAEQAMLEAHRKGTLTVTTEQSGNMVRISFADDGLGISPANMNRLFTPSFTTKELGKGTGLGLSICHGIVTEHGGRIYAESKRGREPPSSWNYHSSIVHRNGNRSRQSERIPDLKKTESANLFKSYFTDKAGNTA